MLHYHHCPLCYEKYECTDECTIEYDLCEDDRLFGSHMPCPECQPRKEPTSEEMDQFKKKDLEFWYKYTGYLQPLIDYATKESKKASESNRVLDQEFWNRYHGFKQ